MLGPANSNCFTRQKTEMTTALLLMYISHCCPIWRMAAYFACMYTILVPAISRGDIVKVLQTMMFMAGGFPNAAVEDKMDRGVECSPSFGKAEHRCATMCRQLRIFPQHWSSQLPPAQGSPKRPHYYPSQSGGSLVRDITLEVGQNEPWMP